MFILRKLIKSKIDVKYIKKEEIIVFGIAIAWAYFSFSDTGVRWLYSDWLMTQFGQIFQFFDSYSLLYQGDTRKPLLFFFGMVILFPYFFYLAYKIMDVDCIKIQSRPVDYAALYLIGCPFFLFIIIKQLLNPVEEDPGLLFDIWVRFSLKSEFHFGIVFVSYVGLICIFSIGLIKYFKCMYRKYKEER